MEANNGNGSTAHWWFSLWGQKRPAEQDLTPYRRLALQLHYDLPRQERSRSVLLVTPGISNLCARGSAALTCCLGEELRRPVLLIDICPAKAEASRILDCAANRGFADCLADPTLPFEELVVPTTRDNVWFLPAGTHQGSTPPAAPEDLSSLVRAAEQRYDFVVLCGGSVLHEAASLALAPYVGCVLLFVIENETLVEDLDAARDALAFCNARKSGLVLTTPLRSEGWFR
jgi:Mrp family chromosome partitioning ATPase